jgi:alanine racemase
MAVVKANAYGHGLKEVAPIVNQNGADWLGVNSLEEGMALRQLRIRKPILILGCLPLEQIKEAIKNNLSLVVYNQETIKRANLVAARQKKKAKVHLKIETGTYRQGIKLDDLKDFSQFCLRKENIVIEGTYTHYANIEDTLDHTFALNQLKKFKKAVKMINQINNQKPLCHTACSAAIILYPKTYFNLVRLGISLYGLWPSNEVKVLANRSRKKIELKPVLKWKSIIAQVKEVAKGETIGYGRSTKANRKMKIAVLPVGYWDGYDRKLSNSGQVLIKGQYAPVVGRICMNMMMVDVSGIKDSQPEEEVILIGKQGENEITAEELAEKMGTINYEVVTRINPLIPRKVV